METSPTIEKSVIDLFDKTFNHKNIDKKKRDLFEQLKKPEICDSLESVELSLFKEDESKTMYTNFKKLINDVVTNIEGANEDEAQNMKFMVINQFVANFNKEMLRLPTRQEMIHNIASDGIKITEHIIDKYLEEEARKKEEEEEEELDEML